MNVPSLNRAEAGRLGYNDCLRHLGAVEEAAGGAQPLRIAVLRSYTVEPIEPVLKLRLLLEGFRPQFWFGGFNQYVQEVLDPGSGLYRFGPDLVLLLVRIEEIMPDLLDEFGSRPAAEWPARIASAVEHLSGLLDRLEHTLPAAVIVQNAALLRAPYFGVFDPQLPDGQEHAIHEFNRRLAEAGRGRRSTFVWDFDALARRLGRDNLLDAKLWYTSRNPFKQSSYPALVDDLLRYILSVLGRAKKCVVVDLDNTLWGGVVGEDGIEGIELGQTYPGNCYRDFQKELLALHRRGVLLAINSKNNEEDALRVIDEHPDMILRREHFAAMRINWRDKASNLRDLARELGIGLESFVFVDDNPAECELVRRECPECEVVQLPDKPYLIPAVPSRVSGLENIRLTDEDRRKGAMYRARAQRRELEQRTSNLQEFLESLDIEVHVEPATPFSIPRIAQLTQKTNQVNMTTRRYTEAQVQALASDPDCSVYSVASRDRLGDDGIVGVFILRHAAHDCAIDSFLLSCRVIGRGIEELMIAAIADLARARGAQTLTGEFLPTSKNRPAQGFFERMGFVPVDDTRYRISPQDGSLPYPRHIRVRAFDRPLAVP
jgi:FkbH-like protein